MRPAWDDCNVTAHADLIAYDQIRQHEERELLVATLKARGPI